MSTEPRVFSTSLSVVLEKLRLFNVGKSIWLGFASRNNESFAFLFELCCASLPKFLGNLEEARKQNNEVSGRKEPLIERKAGVSNR